jgi:hypothetical protein
MMPNILNRSVQIQEKIAAETSMGQTTTWRFVDNVFGCKIPLDVRTIASYQELKTVVSSKIVLRGSVDIQIGKHRILIGSEVFYPQSTAKHSGGYTEVFV